MLRYLLCVVGLVLHLVGCADDSKPRLGVDDTILKAGNAASERRTLRPPR